MRPNVAVVALGAANRRSIAAALERAGAAVRFADEPSALADAGALVIPGVAHFGYLADALDRRGLREPIVRAIGDGTPCLGICAGFQLFFESSDEAPHARGLGLFPGRVRRVNGPKSPHMGWNRVVPLALSDPPQWAYFAHSYAPPPDAANVRAITSYGPAFAGAFASVAIRERTVGVQFHPERSGEYGASLLASFVAGARSARAR